MPQPALPEDRAQKRDTFFKMLFGMSEGVICVSHKDAASGKWSEEFYQYPDELPRMLDYIERVYRLGNTYFCPQLLKSTARAEGAKSARTKDNILTCTALWADLDNCNPDKCLVAPSIVMETSPDRWQALWVLAREVPPEVAEQLCKNIAYHHVADGADTGGWDLTQLLRVPCTYNFKHATPPEVKLPTISRGAFLPEDFEAYREARINARTHDPMPVVLPTESGQEILQRYRKSLNAICFSLHDITPDPDADWSKALWQLQMLCYEAGMSREEVFVVCSDASCNKYRRDNKQPRLLWEEVCRAYTLTIEKLNILVPETEKLVPLLSDRELGELDGRDTFVERYIEWASTLGDAATQYHQAEAFIILSALLAGTIRLPTSFGTIMPNLWFMLLADTTLTRKSTAMDIAVDMLEEVEPNVLLATDGSVEGLLQSLEIRPGKPSLFLRDEFSGLIEAMSRKDYMAGMVESLTKLYDGKTMKRVLKRETVTVRDPCLLIFGGGIKTRVQSLLTLEHVASGFVPRFIFITAESDVARLRPLGPPTEENLAGRQALIDELQEMKEHYVSEQELIVQGKLIGVIPNKWMARLTPEAWDRYNQLEATLLYAGVNSDQPDIMTPVYDRLAKSILKAATLIAAARLQVDEVVVTVDDLLLAIKYGEGWRSYAVEIINGVGRSANEILLQRIYKTIKRHPGISRSQLMQWYHLDARSAEIMFMTMEQRGIILATRVGRTWLYEAAGRMIDARKDSSSDR